jgi:hypothetical protein
MRGQQLLQRPSQSSTKLLRSTDGCHLCIEGKEHRLLLEPRVNEKKTIKG